MTAALLAAVAAWVAVRPRGALAADHGPLRVSRVLVTTSVGALALGVAAGSAGGAALAVVAGGTAWGGHRLWRQRGLVHSAAEARGRVLECCDLLATELTAGQPPGVALSRAAEAWPAMVPVAQTFEYGGDVPAALRRAADGPGADGLRLVAAAWQVSHRTGQGLAEALARLARTLREARATERVVRSELASARATARLVAGLPTVALAVGAGSGGNPAGFLVGTPLGLACLAGGVGLGLAGLSWIERIAAGVGQ
jgi:tight adherence protein B